MRVLILGAGLSGLGAAHLMNQKGHDVTLANGSIFDSSELETLGIKCVYSDDISVNDGSFDVFIKAPGIPDRHPLVASFDTVYNEIEWAAHYAPDYDFYCISGTNGKTTSTMLLHAMLERKNKNALLAGNVGIALSEKVFQEGNHQCDVALEISAFQIDGLKDFHAKAYGLLNLSPDHLDHYDDIKDYYGAKVALAAMSDVFIRNIDDATVVEWTQDIKENALDLSLNSDADIMIKEGAIVFKDTVLFIINNYKLVGKHNLYNAALAASLAYLAGVSVEDISIAISEFKAVEHRCEYVDTIKGVDYYNDSKATNPESVDVCLQSFNKPVYLLAGGYDKKISFNILKKSSDRVAHAYLFGQSANQLAEIYPQHTLVETMEEAFKLATKATENGDTILLSPACASYDQFKNFEERGNQFKSLVTKMKK